MSLQKIRVTRLSSAQLSLKLIIFIRNIKKFRGPVHNASFDTFKAKISRLITQKSSFEVVREIDF